MSHIITFNVVSGSYHFSRKLSIDFKLYFHTVLGYLFRYFSMEKTVILYLQQERFVALEYNITGCEMKSWVFGFM